MTEAKGKSILLVDDEAIIAAAEEQVLKKHGYAVLLAFSGEQAIEMAVATPTPDLILMDIDLGRGMDGTQAAETILATRDIPVLFLSSHIEPEVVEKTEKITSYGYVVKNSGETVLLASIRMAFKLYDAHRALRDREYLLEKTLAERKDAISAVRSSEERFGDLAKYLPVTLFESDLSGRIVFANSFAFNRFGYTEEDVKKGINLLDLIIPEDRQRAVDNLKRVMAGDALPLNEYTARASDGATFPALIHSTVIMREGRPAGIRGFLVDITERKHAEEDLREAKNRYRDIINYLPIGMHLYCLESDGRLVFEGANPAADRILGVNHYQFYGKTIEEAFPPLARTEVPERYREAAARGTQWYTEQIDYADGVITGAFEVHAFQTEPGRMAAVFTDITERKRAARALKESEERWQFALEGAGDGVWDWDAATDRVYFSRQWKAMLGYDDKEIRNELSEWDSRIHPDDRERVYRELKEHLEGRAPVYLSAHRLRCRDGSYKWILDRGKVIARTADGKPKRVIGTHADISAQKMTEEELQKAVSEKGALLSELQHRVKNSLSMIEGIIGLEMARVDDESLREVLVNITGRISSLSNLYTLLFRSDTYRYVDLGLYVQSIVDLLAGTYVKGIGGIRVEQRHDSFQVRAKNATYWGLITNELVTNAFKYAFPGGTTGLIRVELRKAGEGITLTVADNGTGPPPDFSLENSPGLGLLLVKTLSVQLKGALSFQRGDETVFSVRAVEDEG